MKKILLSLWVLVLSMPGFSQLLVTTPAFPTENTTGLEILMHGAYGNKALNNVTTNVYVHTGVITNLSTSNSDWKYVKPANFNQAEPTLQAVQVGSVPNVKYRFTIPQNIRAYYGVPAGETILKIAILFRNANGSIVQRNADGSDMYIPINDGSLAVKFTNPFFQPTYTPIPEPINIAAGGSLNLSAIANASSNMKILYDGNPLASQNGTTSITTTASTITPGLHTVTAEAVAGTTATNTFSFFVPAPNAVEPLPAGVKQGINYEADPTAATLVLYAPFKTRVTVIGDMPGSNWSEQLAYQMKKTADGNYYWLRITGLTPGTEYAYQYLVDGTLRIGDPYTEKVLDPWNDQFIPATTYPGLKPYPTGLTTGVASIMQTAAPAYNWQTTSFNRPDKRNLMVYELLLRDFIARHDWTGMTDTLNYLKNLGINTIELMPVNEFEGNNSWGYNPDYYFAPDKYYGPKNDLKRFIDMAHSRGIAVVLDIALNHSFGLSPMVQLYWDAANNRPAANNPWYNPVAKHAFNVGFDMNHSSTATNYFFSRVVEHWLQEYKMDGFRFDLSKGFTQTQTCDGSGNNCDVNAWSNYDPGRVNTWKKYYDTLQLKSPGSYVILEHFAANTEEKELSDYGMLLWGNSNHLFSQAAKGNSADWNFEAALHSTRGWNEPTLISYMESHDEERIIYRTMTEGEVNGSYNTRNLPVALSRAGMSAAFLLSMPGPKMIWQFGELGYDFSINHCESGPPNNNCRVDPKPIRWDYLQNTDRKALQNVYSNMLQLRGNPLYTQAFTTGTIAQNLSGAFKWMTINSATGKLVIIGNFDVTAQTGSVTFPAAGAWYNYLNPPATIMATGAAQSFTLQPGEYRVYLNSLVALPVQITQFNGRNNGNTNILTWLVENETNLSRYEVQRSENGYDYYSIGTVAAIGAGTYSFVDNDLDGRFYFYRLKSIDADGIYAFSFVIKLGGRVNNTLVVATPNPFRNTLKLRIETAVKEEATLLLTDLAGKIILKRKVNLLQGVNSVELTSLPSLAAGSYMLNLVSATNNSSIRVLKTVE